MSALFRPVLPPHIRHARGRTNHYIHVVDPGHIYVSYDRACPCSQAFTTKHHSARFRAPILAHRSIGSKQAPTPVDPPQPSNRALVVPHDRLFNSAAEKQHFIPRFLPLTCSYSISPPNLARTLLPPLFNLIPTYQRTTSAASSAPADSELSHQ